MRRNTRVNRRTTRRAAHPVAIRVMHWIGVYAMGCMIFSGWEIYNALAQPAVSVPALDRPWRLARRRPGLAPERDVAAVRRRHRLSHLRLCLRSFQEGPEAARPPSGSGAISGRALRFRLEHRIGHYNAVQRLLYGGVIIAIIVQVATGLAIWKPVQFGWLAGLFGGYPIARGIHLAMMLLHRDFRRGACCLGRAVSAYAGLDDRGAARRAGGTVMSPKKPSSASPRSSRSWIDLAPRLAAPRPLAGQPRVAHRVRSLHPFRRRCRTGSDPALRRPRAAGVLQPPARGRDLSGERDHAARPLQRLLRGIGKCGQCPTTGCGCRGLVTDRRPWTFQEFMALPQPGQITRHICIEGWSQIGQWSGVPLGTLLRRVGADLCAHAM